MDQRITTVCIGFVSLFVIYIIYRYIFKGNKNDHLLINVVRDAWKSKIIKYKKIKKATSDSEYTYSFWMYIDDWSYLLKKPKCVMFKGDVNGKRCNPSIWLYPYSNKLMVRVETYQSDVVNPNLYPENNTNMNPLKNPDMLTPPNKNGVQYVCDVPNMPLQRWIHVGVSLSNRTLDVYINGKLARSGILQGIPKMNKGNLYVTQYGGYDGYISCLQVFENAISANEMYNIYTGGPSGCKGWFKSNYFDKYRLKASIGKVGNLEDEQSISIKL